MTAGKVRGRPSAVNSDGREPRVETERARFIARGQVQGVGFRPFVFTLAEERNLTGFVRNSPRGVVIEVQGEGPSIEGFAADLRKRLPVLARITSLEREKAAPVPGETAFRIAASTSGATHAVLISPDTATCADCLADMNSPSDRRFDYPFTNCTNCGPRYTITRSIPYDRAATSMACFPLCPACREEYENPRDRRFHAQPNACPVCGPHIWLTGRKRAEAGGAAALDALADALLSGAIAAIKGLGGFHLACDACDESAVARLRERKHRPHKPFAVMAADMTTARRIAVIREEEEALLLSPEHPVVICRLPRPCAPADAGLMAGVAPDTDSVGVMLPYTPLHVALFRRVAAKRTDGLPPVLVMTSGNPGGEPICLGNREALDKLSAMADVFLFHNRDILVRVDDSVVRHLPGHGPLFYRRARGYVPRPSPLVPAGGSPPCVLGVGAEIKNTLCLTKGEDAFVSQHVGDMANLETAAFHGEIREHLASLLRVRPEAVVRDSHPDYLAGRMAEEYAKEHGLPVYALQHHFAHAHAVLAEHRFSGKALVWALDGTGLGDDGRLWGGELLYVDTQGGPEHRRLAHFAPMDLPGGEAAIREPWRIAHALLLRLGLLRDGMPLPWLPEYGATASLLPGILARRINTPVSTSCGRLFDAVAALLGLCNATSYEGQAAIRLEEAQYRVAPEPGGAAGNGKAEEPFLCPVIEKDGLWILDTHALFAALVRERFGADEPENAEQNGRGGGGRHGECGGALTARLSRRFHLGLAESLAALAAKASMRYGTKYIGLSGGCLQNCTLALELAARLGHKGLKPLLHKKLPPGDGCISLGQASWGRLFLAAKAGDRF